MIMLVPYGRYYWVGGPPKPSRASEEKSRAQSLMAVLTVEDAEFWRMI